MTGKCFTIEIVVEPDEPSGYYVYTPQYKGVHTCGNDIEEALFNGIECLYTHLSFWRDHGESVLPKGEPDGSGR